MAAYRRCRHCASAVLMVVLACSSAATTFAANKKAATTLKTTVGKLDSSPRKVKAQDVKGTLVVRLSSASGAASVKNTAVKKTTSKSTVRPAVASVSAKGKVSAQQKVPVKKQWVEQKKVPMAGISKKPQVKTALNLQKPVQKFKKQTTTVVRAPVVKSTAPSKRVAPPEPALNDFAAPLNAVHESRAKNLLQTAFHYLKSAYRIGGSGPNGFDCSGFTHFIFGKHGIPLPRSSVDQAQEGRVVARTDLKPGDLVFFSTFRRGISHVGIFIANGLFIHSAGRSKGVSLDSMFSNYWSSRYRTARRVDLTGADQMASAEGDSAPFAG